jgi:trimethylamine--corrinoid protein Co-methyltransferase
MAGVSQRKDVQGMKTVYPDAVPGLFLLEKSDLQKIHEATLDLMSGYGVCVFGSRAQEILSGGGCSVDGSTNRVRFPRELVSRAIESSPAEFVCYSRNGKNDIPIGGKKTAYTNFGTGIEILNLETGSREATTIEHVRDIARFIDAVDEIDVFTIAVAAQDVPPRYKDLYEAEATFQNTTKHFFHDTDSGQNASRVIDMAAAIMGGREQLRKKPILSMCICPNSPLEIHEWAAEVIVESSKAGVPMLILSMGLAGGTTPATMAGTLVVTNAEILAGIVLAQLVNQGTPVVYGSSTTIMDMQRATSPIGAPEHAMFGAAVAQLGHYYGIPTYVGGT